MPTYDLAITVTGHDRASNVFKPVENAMKRIFEVAGGILLSRVIIGIGDQIIHLAGASLEATAKLQLMQVSLESLASRELVRASDGMLNLADVEGQAGEMAAKMMDELAKMSILSPYTVEAVQNTFRLNTAFGYTFDQAKLMTDGLLKMASGVGADNEQLNRMAYNLAQVRLQGKVMALDVRQLALAGIDLEDVLRNVSSQFGFTIKDHKDFNELVADGKITWEQFAEGFANYADKYFGKSSEKMAKTLLGLKSTFHDVFILTMPQIIGPSVDKITNILGKLLDMFIKIRDTDILKQLGVSWSANLDKVLNPLNALVDGVNGYIDVWLAASGYTAKGLEMKEAMKQLKEMETPLQLFKNFLTDVFGAKMGGIILQGAGKVVDAARSIKVAIGQMFQGDFTGAFETLGVPKPLINFVNDVIAAIGNLKIFWDQNKSAIFTIFKDLAQGILEFAGVKLGDAFEGTGGLLEGLTRKMIENGPKIVTKLREVKDFILNVVLPAINTFIDKLINEWIPKAITFIAYLKDNWEPILKRIAVIIGVVVAAFAGFSILSTIAGFVWGAIQAFIGLAAQVALAGGITAFLATLGEIAAIAFPFITVGLAAIALLFAQVVSVGAGFVLLAITIKNNWQAVTSVLGQVWQMFSERLAPAFAQLVQAFGPLKVALMELWGAFKPLTDLLWNFFAPIIKVIAGVFIMILIGTLALLTGTILGVVGAITVFVESLTTIIQGIAMMVGGVLDVLGGFFLVFVGIFTGNQDKVNAGWEQFNLGLRKIVGGTVSVIIGTIQGFFGTILAFLSGFVTGALSVWAAFWGSVAATARGGLQELASTVTGMLNGILNSLAGFGDRFRQVGKSIVDGIKAGIQNSWSSLVSWFNGMLNQLVNVAYSALQIWSPSKPFVYLGKMITAGIKLGVDKLPEMLRAKVIHPLKALPTAIGSTGSQTQDDHSVKYYAPVYQVTQQSSDRMSAVSSW